MLHLQVLFTKVHHLYLERCTLLIYLLCFDQLRSVAQISFYDALFEISRATLSACTKLDIFTVPLPTSSVAVP